MKKAYRVIRYILKHPLASKRKVYALSRFLYWQTSQAIWKRTVKYKFVENSVLLIRKGMQGATGNIYTGLLEFEDMMLVLHLLRPGDVFGDVGANVGVYSVLASVNAGAKSIAMEPVPVTYSALLNNINVNNAGNNIIAIQAGIGDESNDMYFTTSMDTVNHVITDKERERGVPFVKVPVKRLDDIFESSTPCVLKIDVEGFEWPVLNGAKKIIADGNLKAVIIEINGSGGRYNIADEQIHLFLLDKGFKPYKYDPFSRKITVQETYGSHNSIYLRDIPFISERLSDSRMYKVFGIKI